MCFFQAVLLAGYAYAHALERWLSPRQMILTHLAVMGLALLVLPVSIASGWNRPPAEGAQFWLLGLLGASIGLPFFALSANGPLLQAWFARTGHRHAEDPYFLYGASNVGSLLALLAYPVFLEPYLTLGDQSTLWTAGYMILIMLIAASAVHMLYHHGPVAPALPAHETAESRPSWRTQIVWAGLAFIPSGLLVAVTTHISTDVAAAPFLWVVPLALFLLTFVITFQRRPLLKQRWMLAMQPLLVALLLVVLPFSIHLNWLFSLALNLGAFFITAMVCHGELVRRRPVAGHLTRFYLWMSLGGMLGGVFTSLIAPYVFSTVIEYPMLILAGLLVRPGFWTATARTWWRGLLAAAAVFVVMTGPKLLAGYELAEEQPVLYYAGLLALGSIIFLSRQQPVRLALMAAVLALSSHILQPEITKGESLRGFFGVNKVVTTPDGAFRLLFHGTTLHG
ncbi:MAG TPA: class I SAM-dependent methyltransferase, partial [Rhodobacteraceae bacterium]|nr:class I SAM-dependent methyltransferase [Paracoccaceae bacterium]